MVRAQTHGVWKILKFKGVKLFSYKLTIVGIASIEAEEAAASSLSEHV